MSSLLQWIAQACFEIYSNNDFLKYLIFLEIKLRITKSYVNEKKKKRRSISQFGERRHVMSLVRNVLWHE
jgi:hypothetical protein